MAIRRRFIANRESDGQALRAVAILFAVLALVLAMIGPAVAGQLPVPIRSCEIGIAPSAIEKENWTLWNGYGVEAENRCPEGLALFNPSVIRYGEARGWEWRTARSVTIDRVEFRVRGGDNSTGLGYFRSNCFGCDPDVTLPPRTSASEPETVVVNDPETPGLFLWAACLQLTCDPSRELLLDEFRFTVSDDEPPYFIGEAAGVDVRTVDGQPIHWTDGEAVPVDVTAYDDGLGLTAARAEVSDPTGEKLLWESGPNCIEVAPENLNTTAICDQNARFRWRADLRDLVQGLHEITLTATDVMSNAPEPVRIPVGIDSIAPDAPAGIEWMGHVEPSNWTSDPGGTLRWDPPVENGESGHVAPIEYVEYSVRKIGLPPEAPIRIPAESLQSPPIVLASEGVWRLSVRYVDSAGNKGDASYVELGYDSDAPPQPDLSSVGWVSGEKLLHGYEVPLSTPSLDPAVESGLCGYAVLVDDEPSSEPPVRIDLPKAATGVPLPADLSEGVHYAHVRAVSCASRGSTTETEAVMVDSSAPRVDAVVNPEAQFARRPVEFSIIPTDDLSGLAELRYSIDSMPFQSAGGAVTLTLGDGVHAISYVAKDHAGNESQPATRVLAVDTQAPTVEFESINSSKKRLITATARDAVSGVATAQIEFRRVDDEATLPERQWRPLGEAVNFASPERGEVKLERTIPDEQLAAGGYEFRIFAVDAAGNATLNDNGGGTSELRSLTLPLRVKPTITAEIADVKRRCLTDRNRPCRSIRQCPRRRRCRIERTILRNSATTRATKRFGASEALVGELLDERGLPLAGRRVVAHAAVQYRDGHPYSDSTTDSRGRFEIPILPGPNRSFTIRFDGDDWLFPAAATATLGVRAGVKLQLSSARQRAGDTLRFRGRLLGAEWLPVDGRRVEIEFKTVDGWRPTLVVQTDERGRFSETHRWRRVTRAKRYRFRARVPAGEPWPFATGSSATATVRVRP